MLFPKSVWFLNKDSSPPALSASPFRWATLLMLYRPPSQRSQLMAQMVKNVPAMQETWVRSLCQEDSLKEGMATRSCILAWEIPCPWRCKEPDMTEPLPLSFTSSPGQSPPTQPKDLWCGSMKRTDVKGSSHPDIPFLHTTVMERKMNDEVHPWTSIEDPSCARH